MACVAAPVALCAAKGGGAHRLAGKVFFWSMIMATASAIWTSIAANQHFVLMLAVLSGYLVISGYRVLYLKRSVPRDTVGTTRPGALDKGLAQFILIACCAMAAWGMIAVPLDFQAVLARGGKPLLMIAIGLAGAMLALGDMRRFRRLPADPHHWLVTHGARMLAGVTAAATGVSVGNLTMLPEAARWLGPISIGLLGTAIWVVLIKRRMAGEGDPRAFVTVRIAEPEPDFD